MQILRNPLKHALALCFFSSLLIANPATARTDSEAQQSFAKALAKNHQQDMDHSTHQNPIDKSLDFHGVFYGYVPCNDCDGIKMTLSLKQNNNYLLVTQPARDSSKEFYEKGKYTWNDENKTVVLKPTKGGTETRHYRIEDESTLIQTTDDGTPMTLKGDRYILENSASGKTREVHIH
jgi:hypothetical protein